MKKRVIFAVLVLFLFSGSLFAAGTGEYQKWTRLRKMAGESTTDANGYNPNPEGQPGAPANPVEPAPPDNATPVPPAELNAKNYYCVVPEAKLSSLEALCKKYGASMKIYNRFKQFLVLKKAGVVVTLDPRNKYFIHELMKCYNARPIKNTSLIVRIHVKRGFGPVVLFEKENMQFINGDFEKTDAILQKIIKQPYGYHSTVFKYIGKNFKGLLESVMEKKDGRKYLYNPDVYIELVALDMNGKNKNVTIFYDEYHYETLSYSVQTNW